MTEQEQIEYQKLTDHQKWAHSIIQPCEKCTSKDTCIREKKKIAILTLNINVNGPQSFYQSLFDRNKNPELLSYITVCFEDGWKSIQVNYHFHNLTQIDKEKYKDKQINEVDFAFFVSAIGESSTSAYKSMLKRLLKEGKVNKVVKKPRKKKDENQTGIHQ